MPVQNEVELLLIGAYFLQIGANIKNRCTKHVYSGRVIFIEIEDHNYELSMDKSTLRSIRGCYQNTNPWQMFPLGIIFWGFGDNLISKSFKKLSLVESLLN